MRKLLLIIGLGLLASVGYAGEPFRIMFYNVENLFDIEHDSLKNDYEFLPDRPKAWTYERYQDKLSKIAKVIIAAGTHNVPDLVGLCEVENDRCLTDLVEHSPLREAGYRYVMTNSPDQRGIDVALLYQRSTFKLLSTESIAIPQGVVNLPPTRDILHVSGQLVSGDTLDVFVCHMPSRSGGEEKSRPYRRLTSQILRETVDAMMAERAHPNVMIMGDFNDYPKDEAIYQVLEAKKPRLFKKSKRLYNLMDGRKEGTYRYRGEWGILDQLIVSGHMLKGKKGIRTKYKKAQILRFPFLLEEDDRYGGPIPSRTYFGQRYHGGYSDHLPVCVDFEVN
ncbi:MAG: endonuclease [Phocaeicola sp.]|nr:endonuclease [Phocaeicola sp.]